MAEKAKEWIKKEDSGKLTEALKEKNGLKLVNNNTIYNGEVVYLSSESDVILKELKLYRIYIIKGLVDKNRYKGICYKHAMGCRVKTAKLPISDFLEINS
jgi:tRNA (guanine9-N1)-methyltransferase